MNEIVIDGVSYELNFGMGFLRNINPTKKIPAKNGSDQMVDGGLMMAIASVIDRDLDGVEDLLIIANKGCNPRLTKDILDKYIDDPTTDVDDFCDKIMGFLEKANATKKTAEKVKKLAEDQKEN